MRHRQLTEIVRWKETQDEQKTLDHIGEEEDLLLAIGAAVAGART